MGKSLNRKKGKGQGLVEFAIVLPILLAITFGLIEFGRLLLAYTAVTASSREAARFGVAIGVNDSDVPHYHDCDGMRAAGLRFGRYGGLIANNISIKYILINDRADPSDDVTKLCVDKPAVTFGDRIEVTSTSVWNSIIPFLNLPSVPITSMASKTIIKNVRVVEASTERGTAIPYPTNSPVIPPTNTPIPTNTPLGPTDTPTNTPIPPTLTPTNTPHPPIDPPINPRLVSWTQNGVKCENIVIAWSPNPTWLSSFPGYSPARYVRYIDGGWLGNITALDPNDTTWDTGVSLNSNSSIRFDVRANFEGIYISDPAILRFNYDCDKGTLVEVP